MDPLKDKAKRGTLVNVWPKAVIDSEPQLGMVIESYDCGICRVFLIPYDGGVVSVMPNVYHKSDPRLYDAVGNITPMGRNTGCWDYLEKPCEKECITEQRVNEICESVCKKVTRPVTNK